ncbi:uncharacterized protein LOC118744914 isoform X1 [Rhagoletis pomonella]|uniref:uncharacterized protein LOC118744914 isoform X1 n=1 Tax=Rhagoletis pomonella TaxID=28610 RepID=UPI0017861181|nr:uncharacterized protein LOC118744914 isoform X1 [Rhagoletis pomonella]
MRATFLTISILCLLVLNVSTDDKHKEQSSSETWQQDLTDTFKIEGSDQGIQKVNLKCGSNSMNVMLETEKPFTGVMYTRGSFYKQAAPCFVKPNIQNARSLEMNFQLDQCQTLKDGELYSNIVVIQNDPELITPGDSAFSLECDFRQPRSLDVEANMQTRDRVVCGSKITLTSPDPSANEADSNFTVQSDTDSVEYVPKRQHANDIEKDVLLEKKESDTIRLGTVEEVKFTLEKDEL